MSANDPKAAGGGIAPWSDYVNLLVASGELNALTPDPGNDQLRAELYRQLAMNVSLAYFMYFQSDAATPDWSPFMNSVFLLQPNPDDVYFNAYVDSKGTYRIVGHRGTVKIVSMSQGRATMGTADRPGPSLRYIDFAEQARVIVSVGPCKP